MPFTHIEKCDMLESYLTCRKNSFRALEEFHRNFPTRNLPNRRYFFIFYEKLKSNENALAKTNRCDTLGMTDGESIAFDALRSRTSENVPLLSDISCFPFTTSK